MEEHANQIVHFTLQGDKKRIDLALEKIKRGHQKIIYIKITTDPTTIDPALNGFTIVDWTSSSRDITNKYDLVFTLRTEDKEISSSEAKALWHQDSRKDPRRRRSEEAAP